jgi:hypothetical protein
VEQSNVEGVRTGATSRSMSVDVSLLPWSADRLHVTQPQYLETSNEHSHMNDAHTPSSAVPAAEGDRFARRVFMAAGIYGLIVLIPQYFAESQVGRDYPPAITHSEYFYGFIGIAVVWQFCFIIFSKEPARYRPLMMVAVLEKLAFAVPAFVLYAQHRLSLVTTVFGGIDLILGALFVTAYRLMSATRGRVP